MEGQILSDQRSFSETLQAERLTMPFALRESVKEMKNDALLKNTKEGRSRKRGIMLTVKRTRMYAFSASETSSSIKCQIQ